MRDFFKKTPGSIGEMIAVALPMVVSFACDTVMVFTDRLFLSKVGSQSMSAAMSGGLSVFVLMSFFLGLIGYTTALAAQYYGAGRKDGCARSLTQAVIMVFVSYPAIFGLIPAAHYIFAQSGIDPEQLSEQSQYFNILVFGSVFSLLRHALSSFFTGIGRTQIVMTGAFIAMITNVALNYILVFGKFGCPALGIKGAAVGTVIASACACVFLIYVYVSPGINQEFNVWTNMVFDRKVMTKLWRFGYPGGIEFMLNLIAFTAMVFVLHAEGLTAAAATTVVFNWDMVTYVPLMGIEIGVTSLVGRYMGAGQIDVVRSVVRSGLKLGLVYALFMIVMFTVFPEKFVGIFRPVEFDINFNEAVPLAVSMLRLIALYVAAQAIMIVFIGALRGAGDTLWAMAITVGIHWVILFILVVMLKVFQADVYPSWIMLVIIFMALSVLPYLRYRTGRWQSIKVLEPGIN